MKFHPEKSSLPSKTARHNVLPFSVQHVLLDEHARSGALGGPEGGQEGGVRHRSAGQDVAVVIRS